MNNGKKSSEVSVVIPTYNREATITRAIQSLQAQDEVEWEAVIVDDGSADRTVATALSLAGQDSRITVMQHDRNQGAQAARNTGIKHSRSKWITFLDSDDYLLPSSLKRRLEAARLTGRAVVHAECNVIHDAGEPVPFNVPAWEGNVRRKLLTSPGPVFPSLLVERSALEAIGYLDTDIVAYQEWDTFIRLSEKYDMAFVPEPVFVYDCRTPVSISRDNRRSAAGYEQVIRKHASAIQNEVGHDVWAEHLRKLAYFHAGARNLFATMQNIYSAWHARPMNIAKAVRSLLHAGHLYMTSK